MLINKLKLFSAGGNQDLVRLYLEHAFTFDSSVLMDLPNSQAPEAWDDLLQKTVSADSLQQLSQAVLKSKTEVSVVAPFIYRRLTDEQQGLLWKKSLGLEAEQSISISTLFPDVEEALKTDGLEKARDTLIKQLSGTWISSPIVERWLCLAECINDMPTPNCIEHDIHQMSLQLRRILLSREIKREIHPEIAINITSGFIYENLLQHGSEKIVRALNDERLLDFDNLSQNKERADWNLKHLECIVLGIKNTKLSQELRESFLDDLLSGKYGAIEQSKAASLLNPDLLPGDYVHDMIRYVCKTGSRDIKSSFSISQEDAPNITRLLDDPRLTQKEISRLIFTCNFIKNNFVKQPDYTFKHVKDLTPLDISQELSRCTSGIIEPSSNSHSLKALFQTMNEDEISEAKYIVDENYHQLSALIENNSLNDEQFLQLANLFMVIESPKLIGDLQAKRDASPDLLSKIDESIQVYLEIKNGDINSHLCIERFYQFYFCQDVLPTDLLAKHFDMQMGLKSMNASHYGLWPSSEGSPISIQSFIAAMDYQPGNAFSLLDALFKKRPEWDISHYIKQGDEDHGCLRAGFTESLVTLAMTREIYPAILSGAPLDLEQAESVFALAVRDCKIGGFDIELLSRDADTERFYALAELLLENPDFSQHHQQANELLLAKVLTRKTDSLALPSLSIGKQRAML